MLTITQKDGGRLPYQLHELVRDRTHRIYPSCGAPYSKIEASGLLLPVTDLQVSFERPVFYDDNVVVCTRIDEFSAVRLSFESQIRRVEEPGERPGTVADERGLPGQLLVHSDTKHVWLNREWRPVRLDLASPKLFALLKKLYSDHV
nr:acyl-CoA thioesterase [Paenibacillus darwinianus]